ncbi:MAG: hypothetical protein MHM6MM_002266 [Cercozoa sp. M6MM]
MIASLEQGVFMSEFDVQITKDEQVIVMHDTSVDRTTPNKGPVSDYTLAQLERMDAGSWKSPLYSSYRVPSLKRMLEAFTTFPDWKSRYLMVDIKYDPERIIGAMAKMNIPRDVLSRLVISPWTEQGANYVRKVFGSVPVVGYINGSVDDDLLQRDNWEGQVLNLKYVLASLFSSSTKRNSTGRNASVTGRSRRRRRVVSGLSGSAMSLAAN